MEVMHGVRARRLKWEMSYVGTIYKIIKLPPAHAQSLEVQFT